MKHLFAVLFLLSVSASALSQTSPWYEEQADGSVQLTLWFYWSELCPHCLEARPVIQQLVASHHWLKLESRQLVDQPVNQQDYRQMAQHFGQEAKSVPAFFFCNTMMVGFDKRSTGAQILDGLKSCKARLESGEPLPAPARADVEGMLQTLQSETGLDVGSMSLPLITVVIAGLDAFNPCAFFVLLFLLSLMIHLKNRARMLLVGGVFVTVSGLVYFVFMAAWLNVFLLFGAIRWVTLIAGVVAVIIATLNIKDYFTSGGVSLSMSDEAKSGLFARMRRLLDAENLPAMLVGTVLLAFVANSYELLCTTGLPMVYTRLLTLEALPVTTYYAYLAAYNVIYVIPLLFIVVIFSLTLGNRKLQAHEGRALKLMSGLMMLGLGLMLVFVPDALGSISVALGIILAAVVVTLVAYLVARVRAKS